jgi:hypothetical protein
VVGKCRMAIGCSATCLLRPPAQNIYPTLKTSEETKIPLLVVWKEKDASSLDTTTCDPQPMAIGCIATLQLNTDNLKTIKMSSVK